MFEITGDAITFLKNYMDEQKLDSPLRVFKQNGCGGVKLALALDQAQPGDNTFNDSPITFLVDQDLLKECGGIKIDYKEPDGQGCGCSGGLTLSSTKTLVAPEGSGGGGCACSSGSCG